MATGGVFGRLPRAAPDLTASIVALVREAQAQMDQNLVDAWKNGGKVEGKGVDDARLLKHMKERRDQLDPSDPQWDEWNSNYMQYDFAINESKMALKNDEGKISDAEMASFYRKWAGREDVQKDSEFYRSLLSRAAKWNAAAKARSAGNSARAAAEAHQNWVNGYYKGHVQGAETANGYLLAIAKTYQAAPPGAQSLDDINPNSDGYGKFLDVIADGKAEDPNVQGLIDEMNRAIAKTNPNWKYSESNLNDLLDRGDAGLKRLKNESTSDSERNNWSDRRATLRYEKTRIKQSHANERVQVAADTYADDLDNCAGDPYCARNVTQKFRDKLQREVPNIAPTQGGINANTQDVKTSSALLGTIRQLDDALAGKEVKPPSAAVLGQGDNAVPEGYTIFDAAAGNGSAQGGLGTHLNGINHDKDLLDKGGWVMTTPRMVNNAQVYDGQGVPMYDYTVMDPNVPQPEGYVAVPGVTLVTDKTRMATGPEGPTPQTVTPVTYVAPSAPSLLYTGPDGNSLSPDTAQAVKLFDGKTAATAPWVELKGVKGPDGKARTLYRTGDGSKEQPYLYHEQPPVPQGVKPNAAGQFVIPTTLASDEKGNPYMRADVTTYAAGVKASRTTLDSGNFVHGTYTSPGATTTAQSIADIYASPAGAAGERETKATKYLRQFQQGIEALPVGTTKPDGTFVPNPDRVAGQRDFAQLSQTASLYAQGKNGKMLGDAYDEANAKTPKAQGYLNELNRQGFTAEKYGQAEMDRRVSLLSGIDDANARVSQRVLDLQAQQKGYMDRGMTGLAGGLQKTGVLSDFQKEQQRLAATRGDVFNPTISVSNIKVPGMPTLQQANQPPVFAGAYGYMGGWSPQAFPAPSTVTPAPQPAAPPKPPPATPPPATPPKTATPPKPTTPTVNAATGFDTSRYTPPSATQPKPKTPVGQLPGQRRIL